MAYAETLKMYVDGKDLADTFGGVFAYDYELGTPEPKTYTVDIPCGGTIDLTESLTGDVAYERLEQTFNLLCGLDDWERTRTRLMNYLHGRSHTYALSVDPGYTRTGRFTVESIDHVGRGQNGIAKVEIKVTADPYKLKEHCMYRLNATGGRWYRFESGRRPVHPVIECEQTCWVTWDGTEYTIPAGAYRLNDVLFTEGANDLYVNTCRLWSLDWSALAQGAAHAMTWGDATAYTWDDLQRLGIQTDAPQSWDEIAGNTWSGLSQKTWAELDYRNTEGGQGSADVYLSYDWEDL